MSTPSCSTLDLTAYDSTKAALAKDPSAAAGSFSTVTTWEDGARARTTARSFVIERTSRRRRAAPTRPSTRWNSCSPRSAPASPSAG